MSLEFGSEIQETKREICDCDPAVEYCQFCEPEKYARMTKQQAPKPPNGEKEKLYLSNLDCCELAQKLLRRFPNKIVKVWGVPRGGIPVVYLLKACSPDRRG